MKTVFYRTIFLLFILISSHAAATHIVGGEMNYLYLSPNHYQITLTVYRDCFNGQAPFDDPAAIGVYDHDGNLVLTTDAFITMQQSVPNAINSPCLTPPSNICYEVAQYVFDITVPGNISSYTVAYQRCCRNFSIMNIDDVQNTGATYEAEITSAAVVPVNSNPVFNDWPPTFICQDAPFTFDHSATDPDGDSLVYVLSEPFEGGDQVNRVPNPPAPPPYTPVTFISPYSVNDPLGGMPMTIDPHTGLLKATPNSIGQFVYGVSVKEYRNGVYLGETRRDFQVNVVPCPQITVASIFSPLIACGSLDAHFTNNSYNAAGYSWNFGDTMTLNDTSSVKNPVYSYPDTGTYHATLIAYSSMNALCNDTATGIIHVYPPFNTDYYITNNHCSETFNFFDQSFGVSGAPSYWLWNFGDGNTASQSSVSHSYSNPGTYNVTLVSSADSGCVDTLTQVVNVLKKPLSVFSIALDTCTYTINATDSSINADAHRWDFGDWISSFEQNPQHYYLNPGNYTIQHIAITDSFCLDTTVVNISIPTLPHADFSYSVTPCDSTVQFTNLSTDGINFRWDFGDDSTSFVEAPSHTYSISGTIPVKLTAISVYGCENVANKDIFFVSKKEAEFNAGLDSCKGLYFFTDITRGAASYYWDFGDSTTSNDFSPLHHFDKDGHYLISFIVNRETVCYDSVGMDVDYESPLGEKLYIPNTFTPNGDGLNDFFQLSAFRPCQTYEITIFNRWGQIVFESDDATNVKWDGRYQGDPMPQDVYVYLLKSDGVVRNGIVNLMR